MRENEQRKIRWQRDFTSGAQQLRQWDNEQLMQATNVKNHCGWLELTGPKFANSTRRVLGVLIECAVTKVSLLYAAETLWNGSDAVRVCTAPLTHKKKTTNQTKNQLYRI